MDDPPQGDEHDGENYTMKRRGFDKEKQADLSGLVKIAGGPNVAPPR